jgi:anti-sigma B factor antagonist
LETGRPARAGTGDRRTPRRPPGRRAAAAPGRTSRGRPDMSDIFRRQTIDDYTVIEFITPSLMDPLVLERTAQALYKIVDEEDHRKIIMDFEKVQYLSSQAIGIVLAMHKKLNSLKNSRLVLCSVGPKLMELIKLTRLDRLLTIKPTQREAALVFQ